MTKESPQRVAVKVDAIAVGLVRFDLQRFDDPQGDVADDEERHQLTTGFALLQFDTVTAPTQPVDDEWRLHNHLHHLTNDQETKKKNIKYCFT